MIKVQQSDKGFTLPLVLGLLGVMFLVGLTSIELAQRGRIASATRQSNTASFYVAETGVSRFLSMLKLFPSLAQQNLDDWSTTYTGATECVSGTKAATQPFVTDSTQANVDNRWMAVDSSAAADPSMGEFRIVDYTYDSVTRQGTLLVEGRRIAESSASGSAIGNTEIASNNAVAAIQAVFNANTSIAAPTSGTLPFLPSMWIGSTTLTPAISGGQASNNNGGWLFSTPTPAPSSGSGGCPNSLEGSSMTLRNLTSSDVNNAIPAAAITNGINNGNPILYSTAAMPSLPPLPAKYNLLSSGITSSGSMNQVLTFPRPSDIDENGNAYTETGTSEDGTYGRFHYLLNQDASGNSIDLTVQNTQIVIPTGQHVTFYLQGNINLSNSKISASSAHWTDFQVYGNQNNLYGLGRTQSIDISNGATVNADLFLFAPAATLTDTSTSTSNVNQGMIWVGTFAAGSMFTSQGNGSSSLSVPDGSGGTLTVKSYPLSVLSQLPASITSLSGSGSGRATVGKLTAWQQEQSQ